MLQTKVPKAIPVVATMTWRWRAIRHVLLAPQRTATRASRARLGAGTRMAFTVASAVLAATALEALAPRGAAVLALPGGSVSVAAATPTAVASARAGAGAGGDPGRVHGRGGPQRGGAARLSLRPAAPHGSGKARFLGRVR